MQLVAVRSGDTSLEAFHIEVVEEWDHAKMVCEKGHSAVLPGSLRQL
jgi:hypothetical protein